MTRRHKLGYEILGLIAISAVFVVILFMILVWVAAAIVDSYCFHNDIVMTEFDYLAVNRWIFSIGGVIAAVCFSVIFLAMLGDRLTYIRTLTKGIDALRIGQPHRPIPLEGKNELTELADAINYMAATQQQLREKEQTLAKEKEQLIRTLSHDIRTPLTSILAYSEYLSGEQEVSAGEQKKYLQTIQKKAEQIRDLTELLLDGGSRNLERFENAHLLFEQLAAEFEEDLEKRFDVHTDLSGCPAFTGTFDVQELRRIFDNLSSNVHKYADRGQPVYLSICIDNENLCIRQTNSIRPDKGEETSYQLGINSIRRIAQHYSGRVAIRQDVEYFSITVMLSDF